MVRSTGEINLRDQRIDYCIRARPKHFSIGSISTPIDLTGMLSDPSIRPAVVPLAARGRLLRCLAALRRLWHCSRTSSLVSTTRTSADLVDKATQEARSGTEGAPLATAGAAPSSTDVAPPPPDPGRGFPFVVTGKGDTAVRDRNQQELDRLVRKGR